MAVLILGGPTGSGKTSLAIRLALEFNAAILSADAMTIYKGLDVGTAKPTKNEMEMVKHHGIDIRNIDEDFSVAEFVELAESLCAREQNLIIAGGTHFYLSALLHPMAEMPAADQSIRNEILKIEKPHEYLRTIDPVLASKLHPNDFIRISRGIEVHMLTGRMMSDIQNDPPPRKPMNAHVIWLEHEDIRERLKTRLNIMVENGYLSECERILEQGWNRDLKPLRAFAYRYMVSHVLGEISLDEAIEKTEFGTWKLVRKQRTWARGLGWSGVIADDALKQANEFFLTNT